MDGRLPLKERLTAMKRRARDHATGRFVSFEPKRSSRAGSRKWTSKETNVADSEGSPVSSPGSIPAKKARRSCAKDILSLFKLSVTISTGDQDIDPALLDNIHKFLVEKAMSGKCSLERGGAAYHLHLQMVLRILATSVIAVSKQKKPYLDWSKSKPPGASVMCRKLTNKGMHTFQGMLAYCMKDADKEHYATVEHNVLLENVQEGLELYSLFGKKENKNKVALTLTNFVDKVFQWRRLNCKHPAVIDFEKDLYEMIRTGKYCPAPSWVVSGYGRDYDPYRMQSPYKFLSAKYSLCPLVRSLK